MILLSVLLILFPANSGSDSFNQIIFWNIGQGQWITAIDNKNCYHFDVGGEFFNAKNIRQTCMKKNNLLYFSHWDWDHIGLTPQLIRTVPRLCVAVAPEGTSSGYKMKLLKSIPNCKAKNSKVAQLNFSYPLTKSKANPNDLSHIFIYDKKLLIPGDSPSKMEKIWSPQIKDKELKWLSASHHGSKTSTSEVFLKNARRINMSFISARKKVYGHPHKIVLERLKQKGISALRTEEWGNIHLMLSAPANF